MKLFYLILLQAFLGTALSAQSNTADSIYNDTDLDTSAGFEGGTNGWLHYIMKNLQYPPDAMNSHITGTVTVQFVIDKKGRVSKIQALSGPEILQQEGIRLIRNSPRWTPAIKNGEKVKSYKKQNISFMLEGSLYNN